MKLIDLELHYWELYEDHEGFYLNIRIFVKWMTIEKCVVLNDDAIENYRSQGKEFIDGLSQRIRSSHYRNDYNRFYPYLEVSKEKKEKISKVFYLWVDNSNAPFDPYFFEN
mgnify:CR=1 FL=1